MSVDRDWIILYQPGDHRFLDSAEWSALRDNGCLRRFSFTGAMVEVQDQREFDRKAGFVYLYQLQHETTGRIVVVI